MNWKWEELSLDARRIMMEKSVVIFQDGGVGELSSLLYGFHRVGYNWMETDLVKQTIFAGIVKHFGYSHSNIPSGRGLASVIYSSGKSGIRWKYIRKDVHDSLFRGISHCYRSFTEQEISNIIHGRVPSILILFYYLIIFLF
jgi:hypothetical protein